MKRNKQRHQLKFDQEKEEDYVGVKLPDEAGEIIVLEVLGKKIFSELWWIPYDETVVVRTPRHNRIGCGIVNHVIGLAQERRRRVSS